MMDTFKRITEEKSSMDKSSSMMMDNKSSSMMMDNKSSSMMDSKSSSMMDSKSSMMDNKSSMENMTTEQEARKQKIEDMIKNMSNTNADSSSSSSDGLADYHYEEEYSKVAKTPSPAPTKTRGSPLSKSYGPIPYYSTPRPNTKTAISTSPESSNQLMEKLNYMIHLLEEQQKESTQNIPEEFALYSLLGIFIIYIVDSFTRAGKYIR